MLELPTPEDLRAERVRLGLTQERLAEEAEVSQSFVARVELGEVDPSYSTLRAIVDALNRAEMRERTLAEVMSEPVVSVGPGADIGDAADEMRDRGFSQLPVVDGGVPVGSVSEEDIVRALAEGQAPEVAEQPVREIMAAPFPALDPDEPVDVALRMLEDRDAVLVVEGGQAIGVLTKADLLDEIEEPS
jgi:predicted transcriptional regulator